jgi:hypothetical protein
MRWVFNWLFNVSAKEDFSSTVFQIILAKDAKVKGCG